MINFNFFLTHIKANINLYLIISLALILRLPFGLAYLEDWDSVQLALGIHHFSVVNHQPHPPGYPLYILLGKISYFFAGNDINALTLLSIILGSLSVIPFYLLVKKMFNHSMAFFASLLFTIIPIHWRLSEIALTDIPGFFFLLLAGYFIYLSKESLNRLILSAILSGLILGFRFNEIPILFALLSLALFYQRRIKNVFLVLGAFVLGISLWLLPLIFITGLGQFINSYSSLAAYVVKHDVFLNSSFSIKSLLKTKLEQLLYLFNLSYTWPIVTLSVLAFLKLVTKRSWWKEYHFQFLLVWTVAYLTPLLFVYNLEHPRHLLPLLPPLIIIPIATFFRLIPPLKIFIPTFLLTLTFVFLQGWHQITKQKQDIPPTIQPVLFVQANFQPQNTTLITSFTYRQFQYYAPEFKNYYSDKIDKTYVVSDKTIIIDYLGLKDKIENLSDFEVTGERTFTGDKDIFTRVPQVILYILEKKN